MAATMERTQKKSDPVAEAREAVASAEAAHRRATQRLGEAQEEIERLTLEVQRADPDDAEAFARLVAARETARARAEALAAREDEAGRAVMRASRAVEDAVRQAEADRLADLKATIAAKDAELTREAEAFRSRLRSGAAELRELVLEANRIEYAANPFMVDTARGLRWGGGDNALLVLANMPSAVGR